MAFYNDLHLLPREDSLMRGSSPMVEVVVNNLARLECEARGIPTPSLTWLKDGSPVSSFANGVQVLSGGRILALTSAQMSDTGRYTCVAVNAAGEKQRDIDLRVYDSVVLKSKAGITDAEAVEERQGILTGQKRLTVTENHLQISAS
ncbi:hypothetical protein STEG23_004404 [Scotinomys teguina]